MCRDFYPKRSLKLSLGDAAKIAAKSGIYARPLTISPLPEPFVDGKRQISHQDKHAKESSGRKERSRGAQGAAWSLWPGEAYVGINAGLISLGVCTHSIKSN
ncbi:hypothetical protein Leryth_026382 [Lithospermum erythrorhizon]|nr:hypothetical protein Leryth_026382 [Lithospermum erythrorhizon]